MDRPSPELRSRSTFDRSPVRASRTPGSVGEVSGNRHLYPTAYADIGITKSVFGVAARRTSVAVDAGRWGRAGKPKTCWTEPSASGQLWGLLSLSLDRERAGCRGSLRSWGCYGPHDGVLEELCGNLGDGVIRRRSALAC